MKTTLMGQTGEVEEFDGLAPSVDVESKMVDLIDEDCLIKIDRIPFDMLLKVIFEP